MSMWRNDIKYNYMVMFPLNNLARTGLSAKSSAVIEITKLACRIYQGLALEGSTQFFEMLVFDQHT